FPGSAGCQPAAFGRCAERIFARSANGGFAETQIAREMMVCGKLPQTTGWQRVLPRRERARAFTLLEIMLAVIILGMMSLAIYRFVQANVTAMRVSSEADAVEARYNGLRELLTQQLQSLPPGTAALARAPLKIGG